MTQLPLWQETVVDQSEIDSLGHMNVRFYLARVDSAFQQILEGSGLIPELMKNCVGSKPIVDFKNSLRQSTRNSRWFDKGKRDCRGYSYFEIRNQETGQLSACFIVEQA